MAGNLLGEIRLKPGLSKYRDRVFDQRREEVVQAYWTLRQTFPDKQLDLDIARSAEAPIPYFALISVTTCGVSRPLVRSGN